MAQAQRMQVAITLTQAMLEFPPVAQVALVIKLSLFSRVFLNDIIQCALAMWPALFIDLALVNEFFDYFYFFHVNSNE